jgi:RNA polymerase subunit RPABC4/transcription elongation factor Spt4
MESSTANCPICVQCGVQFPAPRETCPVCAEQRQFVNWNGQEWTTLVGMQAGEYRSRVEVEGPQVIGIGTEPKFGIGQRALLIQAPTGNVLWDCTGYVDDELVDRIGELGGITAIAISHPHFYSTSTEWARRFDVPVHLHAADREWMPFTDDHFVFWQGDRCELAPGLTLLNLGVHFSGGAVLHWSAGEHGRGALFSGDIVQVVPDRRWVSFMHSYPNFIPERPSVVRRAVRMLEPYSFDTIYGGWWGMNVTGDGWGAVRRSAERYLSFVAE